MMWSRLTPPWRACLEEAWAACCAGSIPIGSVITDPQGLIVARGRNRWHEKSGEAGTIFGSPIAHAEINALQALDYDRADRYEYSLYSTTEPCPLCIGALYMAGIRSLFFAARDPYAGSTNLLGTTPYMRRKRVVVNGPQDVEFETLVNALYVGSELLKNPSPSHASLVLLREQQLCAVTLGSRLVGTGLLRDWMTERIPTADMVDRALTLNADC
jgi:tRNA(Arg) A34 adenosine deaminase TadA